MQGGPIPPRYLEVVLMRELGLKPWEIDEHLTAGDLLDYLACLEGEAKADRIKARTASPPSG